MCLSTLNHDIEDVIVVYEHINGVTAARTRQMIQRYGPIEALSKLVESSELQKGFRILRDNNRLDSTFEALIVRHANLFHENVVEAAQWRLTNANAL